LETNPSLIFDRLLSYGTHLDIAAGTAVRFEPGERKTVSLVEYGGKKLLSGGNGLGTGPFDESLRETKIKEMVEKHKFGHKKQDKVEEGTMAEMDPEVVSVLGRPIEGQSGLTTSTHPCSALPLVTGSDWQI
jgi:urease